MQNTIVKTFEDDPRVVTAIVSQVDSAGQLALFWSNHYLRGTMLFDPTGTVGGNLYQQPYSGVPFSRAWIIAPDQTIVLPHFGYDPQLMIDTIHALLDDLPPLGDITGDGLVDIEDLLAVLGAWGPCAGCVQDINASGAVDIDDLLIVLGGWTM